MRITGLLVVVIFLTIAARAQTASPSPSPTPGPEVDMTKNPGEPIRWELSDGREAILEIVRRPAVNLSAPLTFSESTCSAPSMVAPTCRVQFAIKNISFKVKWAKNPDPSRVGKTALVYKSPAEQSDRFTPYKQVTGNANASDLSPTTIECDDFTWLSGTTVAPDHIALASWSGERMETNEETGLSENLTTVGVFAPTFDKLDDHAISMSSGGAWFTTRYSLNAWFFRSSVLQFVTAPRATSPGCQVAFKPDFSNYEKDLSDAYSKLPLKSVPYIDGSDGYFDDAFSPNFFLNKTTEDKWE